MLRKIMIAAVAAVVALSFTACSSLQVATTLNNEKITTAENATSLAHINGEIWGIHGDEKGSQRFRSNHSDGSDFREIQHMAAPVPCDLV